jgi:hypothetical protein
MPNPKPLRILIVEDDKTSRIVLRHILEALGDQEIYEAEDGLKAWEMLNGGLVPQLCFLDLNMPRMNGIELQFEGSPERGGDSLPPQIQAPIPGDKLSPRRKAELEAALPSAVPMEVGGLVPSQSGVGRNP